MSNCVISHTQGESIPKFPAIDTSNILWSSSAASYSYKATESCWAIIDFRIHSGYPNQTVTLNGVQIMHGNGADAESFSNILPLAPGDQLVASGQGGGERYTKICKVKWI